jgi:hypothetical protein
VFLRVDCLVDYILKKSYALEEYFNMGWIIWGRNIIWMLIWRNVVPTLPSVCICETLKDLISKVGKKQGGCKRTWNEIMEAQHSWGILYMSLSHLEVESIRSKEKYLCIIHDKMDLWSMTTFVLRRLTMEKKKWF